MSTTRKGKAFRVVPEGAARGRGRSGGGGAPVPAGRARVDQGDALERLFEAAALVHVAEEHERAVRAGRPPSPAVPSVDALGWRIKRARSALPPVIRGEATSALAVVDGFLRQVATEARNLGTYADVLPVAARFGVLAASILREERPRSTLELAAALTCAFWTGQAERDAAVLAATPPGHRAKVAVPTKRGEGGTVERSSTADYGERHQRAKESTTQARQERVAFVDLLLRREKGRQQGIVPQDDRDHALADRIDALLAKEQRDIELGKKLLAERVVVAKAEVVVEAESPPGRTPVQGEHARADVPPAARADVPPAGHATRPEPPTAAPPPPPDPFADLVALDPSTRLREAIARASRWRSEAQIAMDVGRAYRGPRFLPGWVAAAFTQAGRKSEVDFMTAKLGFVVGPEVTP